MEQTWILEVEAAGFWLGMHGLSTLIDSQHVMLMRGSTFSDTSKLFFSYRNSRSDWV